MNSGFALAQSLKKYLNDPTHSPIDFIGYDEAEELPWPFIHKIQEWGFCRFLVPVSFGGKLHDLQQLHLLAKTIAQQDVASFIVAALGFFAFLPILLAQDEKHIRWFSERLLKGEIGSIGLTEIDHGSDLAANETVATLQGDHYVINGDKWAINHADKSFACVMLVRTSLKAGPLSYSFLVLDKTKKIPGLKSIPRLKTHGAREMEVGGFQFTDVKVPKTSLVGAPGQGLPLVFRTLQISRTLCASISSGASETALKLAHDFSTKRKLYGQTIAHIPLVRQRLAEAYAYYFAADSLVLCVTRAASFHPERMSLWSAMIKFLMPNHAEHVVQQCGIVLGARGQIRNSSDYTLFQKLKRDNELMAVFDGSSEVNLSIIANHLLQQALKRSESSHLLSHEGFYRFDVEIPEFDFKKPVVLCRDIDVLALSSEFDDRPEIKAHVEYLYCALSDLDKQVILKNKNKQFNPRSIDAATLSETYCWIIAALCALRCCLANPGASTALAVAEMYVHSIKQRLTGTSIPLDLYDKVYSVAIKKFEKNESFALFL